MGVLFYKYSFVIFLAALLLSIGIVAIFGKKAVISLIVSITILISGLYTSITDLKYTGLAQRYVGEKRTYQARIVSIPSEENYGQKAVADMDGLKIQLYSGGENFSYGDVISFTSTPYFPDDAGNGSGFDYRAYLKSEGVYLCAYTSDTRIIGSDINFFNPMDLSTVVRGYFLKKSNALWRGETLMFARAILLGNTDMSSEEFRETLSKGGISHVIAVSGMHVGIVAGALLLLLRKLTRRKRAIRLLVIPPVLFFTLLVGASPSANRAATMLILAVVASCTIRRYDGYTSLAFAALLLLIINPFTIYSLSFQLSFAAVFGIITFYRPLVARLEFLKIKYLREVLCVTLSAQIFIIPILALNFGSFQFAALITNFIAVPLVPYIMASGYAALMVSVFSLKIATLPAAVMELMTKVCIKSAEYIGSLKLSSINTSYTDRFLFILVWLTFVIFLYTVLVKGNKYIRLITYNVFLATLLLSIAVAPFIGNGVYFLNAERGNCALIKDGRYSIMIDCQSNSGNFAKYTAVPFMEGKTIKTLDVLALTDYTENCENVLYMLEEGKVKCLVTPEGCPDDIKNSATDNEVLLVETIEGDEIKVGDMVIKTIYSAKEYGAAYRISSKSGEIVILGNISLQQEKVISEKAEKCDILKTAGNGSVLSCDEELLSILNPEAVIISTDRKVKDKLKEKLSGYRVYSTYENGIIYLKGKNIFYTKEG